MPDIVKMLAWIQEKKYQWERYYVDIPHETGVVDSNCS